MKFPGIKYSFPFLFIVVIVACNNNNSNTSASTDTAKKILPADTPVHATAIPEEKDIIDTLIEISFVKEANRQIDSITHHKHGISFIIDTAENEYNIQAGYNGIERFETRYIFSVDKKTRAIKVEDVISGDMMPVAEFEKLKRSH